MSEISSAPNVRIIPERWEECVAVGGRVPGTPFICFKVPLSEKFCSERLSRRPDWFTPKDLIKLIEKRGEHLGLVISLTPIEQFYEPLEFTSIGINHQTISGSGKGIPSSKTVRRFFDVVKEFEHSKKDKDFLIGVHCTNGINRSGYVVCRYLIQKCGRTPKEAIEVFNSARGHPIDRSHYLDALTNENSTLKREKLKTKKDRSGQNSSKEKGKKRKRKDKKEDRQEKKKLKRNDKVPREEGGKSSKEESNQRGSDESSQFEEGELLVLSETGEKEDPIESETKTAEFGFIRVFNPVKETTSSSSGLPTIGVRHLLRMGKDDRIETVSPFQSATISSTADIVSEDPTPIEITPDGEGVRNSPAFVPIPAADDSIETSVAVKMLVTESGSAKILTAEELEDLEDGEVRSDEDEEAAKLREQKRKLKKIKSATPTVKLDEKEKSKNLLYNKVFSQIRTKKMPIGIVIKSTNLAGTSDSPQPPVGEGQNAEAIITDVVQQKLIEEPTSTTGDVEVIDQVTPNVSASVRGESNEGSMDPSPIYYVGAYVPASSHKAESGRTYRETRPHLTSHPVGSSTPINPESLRKHAGPKLPWEIDEPIYPYGPPASGPQFVPAGTSELFPPAFNVPPPTHHGSSAQPHFGGPPPVLTGPNYRGGGLDPSFERYVPPSIRGFDGRQDSRRDPNRRSEQQLSGGNAQPLPQHRVSHHHQHNMVSGSHDVSSASINQPFNTNPGSIPASNSVNNSIASLMTLLTQGPPSMVPTPVELSNNPQMNVKNQPAPTDPNNPVAMMQQLLMQTFLLTACQQMTSANPPPVSQSAQPQLDPMATLLMTAMLGVAANTAMPTTSSVNSQQTNVLPNVRNEPEMRPCPSHQSHQHSRKRHTDGVGHSHSNKIRPPKDHVTPRPLLSQEIFPVGHLNLPQRPAELTRGAAEWQAKKTESSDEEGLVEEEEIVDMASEKEEGEASDSSGTKQKSQGARRRERRRRLGGKFATMKKGKFWQIYDMQYSKT